MCLVVDCAGTSTILDKMDYVDLFSEQGTMTMSNGYPSTSLTREYIHTWLMKTPPGITVDHINWSKTDNRRANLRLATQSQQNVNRSTRNDKQLPNKVLAAPIARKVMDYYLLGKEPQPLSAAAAKAGADND